MPDLKRCREGDHPLDRRTEAAGGEVCYECATREPKRKGRSPIIQAAMEALASGPALILPATLEQEAFPASLEERASWAICWKGERIIGGQSYEVAKAVADMLNRGSQPGCTSTGVPVLQVPEYQVPEGEEG